MTLIISARFNNAVEQGDGKSGVVIVADRLVTKLGTDEREYQNKIILPSALPVAFCASGFVDLFKEFNRKILEKVDEQTKLTHLNNIRALKDAGYKETDITKLLIPEKVASSSTEEIGKTEPSKKKERIKPIVIPYIYSGEDFLDDCRTLIKQICANYPPNSLEVIIAINRGNRVSLHKINSDGDETEIFDYSSTGSGEPYVRILFQRLWKKEMSLIQTIHLAALMIKFAEEKVASSGVGIENGTLPQAVILWDAGERGNYTIGEEDYEEFNKITTENLSAFDMWLSQLKVPQMKKHLFQPVP